MPQIITPSHLTDKAAGSDTGIIFTTGSIAPAAKSLLLATFYNKLDPSGGNTPTLTGLGLTWTQHSVVVSGKTKITVFRAVTTSAPTPGTCAFDFAGQAQQNTAYSIDQFLRTKRSGTNGSDAIVQVKSQALNGVMAGATLNLDPLQSSKNVAVAAVGFDSGSTHVIKGSNFSYLYDNGLGADAFGVEYAENKTACDFTWGSLNTLGPMVALEIAAEQSFMGAMI